jgi:hypothetical protein
LTIQNKSSVPVEKSIRPEGALRDGAVPALAVSPAKASETILSACRKTGCEPILIKIETAIFLIESN